MRVIPFTRRKQYDGVCVLFIKGKKAQARWFGQAPENKRIHPVSRGAQMLVLSIYQSWGGGWRTEPCSFPPASIPTSSHTPLLPQRAILMLRLLCELQVGPRD